MCSVCGREAEINALCGIIKYNKLFCASPDFLSFPAPMSSREEWGRGKGREAFMNNITYCTSNNAQELLSKLGMRDRNMKGGVTTVH